MTKQIEAAQRYAQGCFLNRHDTYGATTTAEKIGIQLSRRWEARYALRHLRTLRKSA